jgi:hypothetical protein
MIRSCFLAISFILISILFPGCMSDPVEKDLKPIAGAMCRMIEAEKNVVLARKANDQSMAHKYRTEQLKIEAEITVINQEFREKYREQIDDEEFKRKVREYINKLLEDCPCISTADSIPFDSTDPDDSLDFH